MLLHKQERASVSVDYNMIVHLTEKSLKQYKSKSVTLYMLWDIPQSSWDSKYGNADKK